jgi:hypothetical protein
MIVNSIPLAHRFVIVHTMLLAQDFDFWCQPWEVAMVHKLKQMVLDLEVQSTGKEETKHRIASKVLSC